LRPHPPSHGRPTASAGRRSPRRAADSRPGCKPGRGRRFASPAAGRAGWRPRRTVTARPLGRDLAR
jgi:hypothetical protein